MAYQRTNGAIIHFLKGCFQLFTHSIYPSVDIFQFFVLIYDFGIYSFCDTRTYYIKNYLILIVNCVFHILVRLAPIIMNFWLRHC
jgi:hypothetical protein